MEKVGFKKIATSAKSSADLQPGDILMHNGVHIEIYVGNDEIAGARHNEHTSGSRITGGKVGDQTGEEVAVSKFPKTNKFDSVWRATR